MLIIPIYGSVVHHKISVDICKVVNDCGCGVKPFNDLATIGESMFFAWLAI